MKRLLLLLIGGLWATHCAFAAVPDSIARKMTLLAAHDNTAALRPLYRLYGRELETSARLFCDLAFAREQHDDMRQLACIDSLLQYYPRTLPANTRFTLSVVKAEAMIRAMDFKGLARFCTRELKRYRGRSRYKVQYATLQRYRRKALRLSDASTPRGRMMRLIETEHVEQLRPYVDSISNIDRYARLMLRLSLQNARFPDMKLAATADSLLLEERDSLDDKALRRCLRAGVRGRYLAGEWKSLYDFCQRWMPALGEPAAWLEPYARIGQRWAERPATGLERPDRAVVVNTSLEWPMLTTIGINGQPFDNIIIETGYPVTMVSEDEAQRCHLEVLEDTLHVQSMFGLLRVRPALARTLSIGALTLTNVPIYVATADNPSLSANFTGLLGISALARTGCFEFRPERLIFPRPSDAAEQGSDLFFSTNGSLLAAARDSMGPGLFALDTGGNACMLTAHRYAHAQGAHPQVSLTAGEQTISLPYVELSATRAADHEGVLGLPFFRSFKRLRLDLRRMRLTAQNPTPFHYMNVEQWINAGNLFQLNRNLDAICTVADDLGCQMAEIFAEYGKNMPEELCKDIEELSAADRASRESPTLLMMRLQALEDMGQWADAARAIRQLLANPNVYPAFKDTLASHLPVYAGPMSAMAPTEIDLSTPTLEIPLTQTDKSPLPIGMLTVGKRKGEFVADVNERFCHMTAKTARKLRIKPLAHGFLWHGQSVGVAVVPEMQVGGLTVRHLMCLITPEKEQRPVTLGNDLWRRLDAMGLSRDRLVCYDSAPDVEGPYVPLRLDNGRLYVSVRDEAHQEWVMQLSTDRQGAAGQPVGALQVGGLRLPAAELSHLPATPDGLSQGQLSISRLCADGGTLLLDFGQMQATLSR